VLLARFTDEPWWNLRGLLLRQPCNMPTAPGMQDLYEHFFHGVLQHLNTYCACPE
jgi:hypothetical protein